MTNAKLKRKAKQMVMLIEMGRITPEQVKRKVRPQFWNDYVLPLLRENYIPLMYARIYAGYLAFGNLREWIKNEINFAKLHIRDYQEAVEKNLFPDLADQESQFNDTPITADQMRQSMEKQFKEAQQKIKYYYKTYPMIVNDLVAKGEIK